MTDQPGRHAAGTTPLFAALERPECYPHPVTSVRVVETHISWVMLTGTYAYKIKKPVNLGFVDFTAPGMRRYYCEEEVRLNHRLAPDLYLGVVSIRGDPGAPHIDGEGPVLDHAVQMREFPQEALASRMLAAGTFGAAGIDALAALVAAFHTGAPAARADDRLGAPETIQAAALQNFEQMLPLVKASPDDRTLRVLRQWTEREFAAREATLAARKRGGFVRECHGDLHLGNIAVIDGRPVPFDCIEFNEELRWIDVMSEVAFLVMDLEDRGRSDLAWRFLNRYLEQTGDYAGLDALRYYLVYRALVRAKVHLMREQQPRLGRNGKLRLARAFHEYLRLASRYAAPEGAVLVLTHGLSGCGKTTATQLLIEQLGAVRIRSDVERKRLHGLALLAASGSEPGGGIYTLHSNTATYQKLGDLARDLLRAGYPVVVDAAFLKRVERESFRAIAESLGAPFAILDFRVPPAVLRARITERQARGDDASEADLEVLDRQIPAREPLTPAEMAVAVAVDGTRSPSSAIWLPFVERLHALREQAVATPRPARSGRSPASKPG